MRAREIALGALLAACGHTAGNAPPAGPATSTGGTVQPPATSVSGTFYLGAKTEPASGFEVWLFDHSAPAFDRYPLGADGTLSIPIAQFTAGHTYSLHLLRDWQLYGDIDLAPAVPGSQPAFTYQGGYGFDLGAVVVPVDRHGEPDLSGTSLVGQVGGGFSLLPSVAGGFATYPLPAFATALQLGSQLLVFDAETMLASFYQRAANPSLYARDLQRLSRIGGTLVEAADNQVSRVELVQAGGWLAGARLPSSDAMPPEASPFWSTTDDAFTELDKRHHLVSVYADGLPAFGTVAVVRIQPASGAEAVVPLVVPRVVTFPPEVVAAAVDGGATSAVNYSATSGANGLTQPFCLKGDLVLDVAPPLDQTDQPIPATILSEVEATFDYYTATSGQTTPVTIAGNKLTAPYNAADTDSSITDEVRSWNPTTLTLTFTLGPTVTAAAAPELRFPAALFPTKVGSSTVTMVRLRLVYRSPNEATAGGVVVWVAVGNC